MENNLSRHNKKSGEIAEKPYDKVAGNLSKKINLAMRAWLYENYGFLNFIKKYANIKKGDIWIEGGVGYLDKMQKTQQAFPGVKIYGFDNSFNMLKEGLKKYPSRKGDVINADFKELPFRDKSVNGFFLFQTLHHLSDDELSKALLELRRVLVNNGQLVIIDTFLLDLENQITKTIGIIKEVVFKVIEDEYVDNMLKYSNLTKKDFLRIMSDNGFRLVKGMEHSGRVITLANKIKFFISEPMIFEKGGFEG